MSSLRPLGLHLHLRLHLLLLHPGQVLVPHRKRNAAAYGDAKAVVAISACRCVYRCRCGLLVSSRLVCAMSQASKQAFIPSSLI
jgi:hypothetical protein